MRTRRGSSLWAGPLGGLISMFKVGDVVKPVTVEDSFTGVVRAVDTKVNKVWVAWGGGAVNQHDPDEIQLIPFADDVIRNRYASRRESLSKKATNLRPFAQADMLNSRRGSLSLVSEVTEVGPQYVGDPKLHGLDKPRGGGFSIMQELQKDLAPEALEEAEEGPKLDPIQGSKKAARYPSSYFAQPGAEAKAKRYGLIDVENEDLTGFGLAAKMLEWQESEGGVEAFVYDDAMKRMKMDGVRMPRGVERVSSENRSAGVVPGVPDGTGPHGRRMRMLDQGCPFDEEEEIEASDRDRVALTVPERHQMNIAIKTLKMHDIGARIMGGMTKEEAREFLKKIGWSDSKIRRLEASDRSREAVSLPPKLRKWEDLTDKFRKYYSGWPEEQKPDEVLYNQVLDITIKTSPKDGPMIEYGYPIGGFSPRGAKFLTDSQYKTLRRHPLLGIIEVFGREKVRKVLEDRGVMRRLPRVDWDAVFGVVTASRSKAASAGPHTLMVQLSDDLRKGKLDDEQMLKQWSHGMGYTKGADYIVGAGEDIVWALLDYDSGRMDADKVRAVIKKNIRKAVKDNEIFKGLRGEERETHDRWMQYSKSARAASLRTRRAMYWTDKGRVYRLTRMEQDGGIATCPRCKKEMEKQPFTKSDKLLTCPECGFKIPTSSTITERKVEVEVEPDGTVEVEVQASSRRGRNAAIEVPGNLSSMTLSEIAALISADWTRVNYAAKPYLEAMFSLDTVKDMYGLDTGTSIVAYFLSNANSWRGDVAKAVKKELKRRIR